MTPKINVIGAGKLGRTLTHLWFNQGVFEIGDVMNRSLQSTAAAIVFIGAGRAVENINSMQHADVYLLSVPDDAIANCAQRLLESGIVKQESIIFHCSGALPSTVLMPAELSKELSNIHFASVHPMRSFADLMNATENFAGTFCAIEGDSKAVQTLTDAFEKIGAQMFSVNAQNKTLYHAACCITSNYLTALMDFALQCFKQSGVQGDQAMRIMQPLAQGTLDNIFSLGPVGALTGPIERGDLETVRRQLECVVQWDAQAGEFYRLLSNAALELSRHKGSASEVSLAQLTELLEKFPQN